MKKFRCLKITFFTLFLGAVSHIHAADISLFQQPFSKNSLWNSKPINPVFDEFVIPTSEYFPSIHNGQYSTGCFLATQSDPPMKIKGHKGQKGIYDADAERMQDELLIPHWPADLVPASGGDGHADVFDTATGIIHSFWQLKKVDGEWRATHYGWMPMSGTGWGDGAHYHQGARAVGIPACAGIIRKHEIADGESYYHHALALSLTQNGLSPNPPYVFPATASDTHVARNKGAISEGSLLMLPNSVDISLFKTSEIRKIAKTLQIYGAYVVDENYGTPYVIYVEKGGALDVHKGLWNSQAADELQLLRKLLKRVNTVSGYVDAQDQPFKPNTSLNILSMRGPWNLESGSVLGKYDTYSQAIVFDNTQRTTIQSNESGRSMPNVIWAKPKKGEKFKLSVSATGGALLNFKILEQKSRKLLYETGNIGEGKSIVFEWPDDAFIPKLVVTSGSEKSSKVSASLIKASD